MKKQALTLVGVLSLLLVAGSAFAQSVQGNVPFSFTVNNATLPAGSYTISPIGVAGTLLIKGDGNEVSRFMSLHGVQSLRAADSTKLVFHCYSAQKHCFLYQVWIQGETKGRELQKSPAESELSASLATQKVIMARVR